MCNYNDLIILGEQILEKQKWIESLVSDQALHSPETPGLRQQLLNNGISAVRHRLGLRFPDFTA